MNLGFRLRQLESDVMHWFPGARVEHRRSQTSNDYEVRIRISDFELMDPEPVGQLERDRDRLLDEARD